MNRKAPLLAISAILTTLDPAAAQTATHVRWTAVVNGASTEITNATYAPHLTNLWACQYRAPDVSGHDVDRTVACTDGVGVASLIVSCKDNAPARGSAMMMLRKVNDPVPDTIGLICVTSP